MVSRQFLSFWSGWFPARPCLLSVAAVSRCDQEGSSASPPRPLNYAPGLGNCGSRICSLPSSCSPGSPWGEHGLGRGAHGRYRCHLSAHVFRDQNTLLRLLLSVPLRRAGLAREGSGGPDPGLT